MIKPPTKCYYLKGPDSGQVWYLTTLYGAIIIDASTSANFVGHDEFAVVCVVDNDRFDGSGLIYDKDALKIFSRPGDHRPKTWLLMHKSVAYELSGYKS